MSNQVCSYYNVGYCKEKNECSKIHPIDDCEEKCKDKTCLKRHRILCRDKESCIYYKSSACEFIHENVTEERQTQIDLLMKENKELKEEINKKNIQLENFSKDIVNILKRVDALENKKNLQRTLNPKKVLIYQRKKFHFSSCSKTKMKPMCLKIRTNVETVIKSLTKNLN